VETIKRIATGHLFNVADQFIKHLTPGQAAVSAAVQYDNDRPHELTEGQFWDLIDAYAIPRVAVYGERNVPAGYVWSAEHEIRRVQGLMYQQLTELVSRDDP
jgi:hypothetical protein